MTKLNQIIAVEKGVKRGSLRELTDAHHRLQKPAPLAGISRTYQPKDEDGELLPPESTRVQVRAEDVLRMTAAVLTRLFDVTATKDWANCSAKADVLPEVALVAAEATAKITPRTATRQLGLFCAGSPRSSRSCHQHDRDEHNRRPAAR